MDSLISDIKEKNRATLFSLIAFLLCVKLADFMDPPRSLPDTVLKGNRSYFDNFKEAFYLKERDMDPYSNSQYFSQSYLVFWVLYQIRNYPIVLKILQLMSIIMFATLFGQIVGGTRRAKSLLSALLLVNPLTVDFV
jgi:hypothetical protein